MNRTKRGSIITVADQNGRCSIITRKGYPLGTVWKTGHQEWTASSGDHLAHGLTRMEAANNLEDQVLGSGKLAIGKDADGNTVFV